MQKKKIIYLITKSNWGGAQRYVYDLATNLDLTKWEPVVALGGDGELTTKLEEAGIRIISLNALQRDISISKELSFANELWQILKVEKPDILHVNSSKAGGVGCLLGRLASVPRVIFSAHGWAFNEDRPWWQRLVVKTLHWVTVLLSHKTIAVSSGMKAQLRWLGAQSKMTVINPGRTITAFLEREDARTKITNVCPALLPFQSDPWLMIIAELHPIKQHQIMIKAMQTLTQQHPELRLVCIGDGSEHSALLQSINAASLQDNIFLVGSIHEAALYLKAADLFVLPSRSESYGYVLHEAALAQVPTVASNVGGIPDIIEDSTTGTLVPASDVRGFSEAITNYLTHPERAAQHASAAYAKLQKRTIEHMVTQTTTLYNSK